MICPIVKDSLKLALPSVDATSKDAKTINDLKDTLKLYENRCVGMSASMIGHNKKIMIIKNYQRDISKMFDDVSKEYLIIINPQIVSAKGKYKTVESCLSVDGMHEVERFRNVEIHYLDEYFHPQSLVLNDMTAQIFLHEYDHFYGKLI